MRACRGGGGRGGAETCGVPSGVLCPVRDSQVLFICDKCGCIVKLVLLYRESRDTESTKLTRSQSLIRLMPCALTPSQGCAMERGGAV